MEENIDKLSVREKEVFQLLVSGKTLAEISEILGIKYNTVAEHYKSIYKKLGVKKRSELIIRFLSCKNS